MPYTCDICGSSERITSSAHGTWCKEHAEQIYAWRHAELMQMLDAIGGPIPQTCPRRMHDMGPWQREQNLDVWTLGHGLVSQDEMLSCSFCGSLHPEIFLQRVEEGWGVHATDKSYKAYLGPGESSVAKFYYQHFDEDQQRRFVDLWNEHRIVTPRGTWGGALPFFMSLRPQ